MLLGNDNRITAATDGNAKQEIKKRFPVFLRFFLSDIGVKARKDITEDSRKFCHIFLAVCSNNDGKNITSILAKSLLAALKVLREVHIAESVSY